MNGLIGYGLAFVLIVSLAIGLASYDGVAVTVTEARAGTAIGMKSAFALETLVSWSLRALIGGIFTGVVLIVYREYKNWKRRPRRGRWKAGPNANFSQMNSVPKFTKNELMLMAMVRGEPKDQKRPASLGKGDFPTEIDVEF